LLPSIARGVGSNAAGAGVDGDDEHAESFVAGADVGSA
jgi:hypothetical protein